MHATGDLFHIYDAQSGHFINETHRRVAEILHDYDSDLSLVWIPPADRETRYDHDFPFALLYSPEGRQPQVVRHVKESDVNENLLAWVWANDGERNNPIAMLEKAETARQAMALHAQQEERDEAKEIGAAILNSPLHTFKHNGKVYT